MKYLNPYRLAVEAKNLFYEKGWLKPQAFRVPIISVGNLTTGGTGKTPVVLELISLLKDKSILVVSKSYKAKLPQPAEVTEENLFELTDFKGYKEEFLRLFGFGIKGVDYDAETTPLVKTNF